MALEITASNFEELLKSDQPVLVDFWAEWCGPCRQIAPMVEELAKDYEGRAVVGKVDIDSQGEIASQFGITSIPTLIVFKGGQPVEAQVGGAPKSRLAAMIDKHL